MTSGPEARPKWSVVVPFYNEERFLGATLETLAAQTVYDVEFVLIDNGSTDGSALIADRFRQEAAPRRVVVIFEGRPGKASALESGIAAANGELIATCDADTRYPPDYLSKAQLLFDAGGPRTHAVLAFGAPENPAKRRLVLAKGAAVARLMPRQTHSGGYGQSFRAAALRAVGGFSRDRWRYCLMDHEIMHRIAKRGRLAYSPDHWCEPSARRADRRRVRWTAFERLLYHVTPFERKDWFFYEFLARRFEKRGVGELNLRRKEWDRDEAAAPQAATESAFSE